MNKYKLLLGFFSICIFFVSCTNKNGKHTEEGIKELNGHTQEIKYYPDGGIKELISMRDSIYDGPAISFNEKGDVIKYEYFKQGKLENETVDFIDSGKIKKINTYESGQRRNSMYFTDRDFEKINDPYITIITGATPFVTIDTDQDTITLGDTFKANINLNCPFKEFDYNVYAKDPKDSVFHLYAKGTHAEINEIPKREGEYILDISILEVLKPEYNKNKPFKFDFTFALKCFVKAKS